MFVDLLTRSRTRVRGQNTGARFKEILGIVMGHELQKGLTPEKVVAMLQDLGPTFVKLGQIASTHPDVLPQEYCDALGALRTKARPMDYETVRACVEGELGRPLSEIFSSFDEHAVGSASIAQVHRAVLASNGAVVAVKVQRPGVVETVTNDLAIMERLVDLYDFLGSGEGGISFKELVAELVRTSSEELDFANEERNLERFWHNNEPREGVTSPRCYTDLSTSAVLVEDYVASPCVEDVDAIAGLDESARDRLAYLIARNYMDQVMVDGFYHADPHAGNVLITGDAASGFGIEWIDFGMMGTLTARERDVLSGFVEALVRSDAYGLKRAVFKVATPRGPVDHGALLDMCESIIDSYVGVSLEDFDTGALMNDLMGSLKSVGFDVEPFLANLGRGLVTLEGTIHLVSPRLNIMLVLMEYARSSFDVAKVASRMRRMLGRSVDSAEAAVGLPNKASETLDMLQRGQVKMGMGMEVDERFVSSLRNIINTFALALMAAGVFMGSCILCLTDLQPQIFGVPLLGILGFASGLALAIYVFVSIFRHKG